MVAPLSPPIDPATTGLAAEPAIGANRFNVAPMLDYTDRHFRVLMRQITRHSLLYSEMVVAQALHHCQRAAAGGDERAQQRLERLIGFDACEHPVALQLGGDDPALLAEATRIAADRGYDEVNLNVGCPSEKVQKGRFGACLMAEPDQVARCIAAMAEASPLPVTVKHRIGIDERDSYAELLQFVDTVAAAGARRFSVHARKAWLEGLDPKQNRTIPPLRHDLVHQLKRDRPALTIELNGGLQDLESCQQQLQLVDGVMVGRAAYDHPLRWAPVDQLLFGERFRVLEVKDGFAWGQAARDGYVGYVAIDDLAAPGAPATETLIPNWKGEVNTAQMSTCDCDGDGTEDQAHRAHADEERQHATGDGADGQ